MTRKLLTIIGAGPQFIKAAAVSRAVAGHEGLREGIAHTGQHYGANMSDIANWAPICGRGNASLRIIEVPA